MKNEAGYGHLGILTRDLHRTDHSHEVVWSGSLYQVVEEPVEASTRRIGRPALCRPSEVAVRAAMTTQWRTVRSVSEQLLMSRAVVKQRLDELVADGAVERDARPMPNGVGSVRCYFYRLAGERQAS